MASYTQWRRWVEKDKQHRVLWVCGSVPTLIEEIPDYMVYSLEVTTMGLNRIDMAAAGVGDMWALLNQYPLDNSPRLTVVRSADKISDWSKLEAWITSLKSGALGNTYTVFLSDLPDFPLADNREKGKRPLQPHVRFIQDYADGAVVRCLPLNLADSVAWVQRQMPMPDDVAEHLLLVTGGDLRQARNVCRKLSLFDGVPTTAVVDLLSGVPASDFVGSLVRREKAEALKAARHLGAEQLDMVLGRLDATLEDLARLYHLARTKRNKAADRQREFGARHVYLAPYLPAVPYYDQETRTAVRTLLSMVSEAHRSGARIGLLELLVMGW